jgi:hypothetical protein
MTHPRFKPVVTLFAVLASIFAAGCTTTASDGRYQTRGGGWDNFRAEVPGAITRPS